MGACHRTLLKNPLGLAVAYRSKLMGACNRSLLKPAGLVIVVHHMPMGAVHCSSLSACKGFQCSLHGDVQFAFLRQAQVSVLWWDGEL